MFYLLGTYLSAIPVSSTMAPLMSCLINHRRYHDISSAVAHPMSCLINHRRRRDVSSAVAPLMLCLIDHGRRCDFSLVLLVCLYLPAAASDSQFVVVRRGGASNCLQKNDSFGFDEVETADFVDSTVVVGF